MSQMADSGFLSEIGRNMLFDADRRGDASSPAAVQLSGDHANSLWRELSERVET